MGTLAGRRAAHVVTILLSTLGAVFSQAAAGGVAAPSGWSDTREGEVRVLARGGLVIRIGPWERLGSSSLRDWLLKHSDRAPPGVALVSSQTPKRDDKTRAQIVTRRIRIGGKSGQSTLGACPGEGNSARTIELYGANGAMLNLLNLMPGSTFMEKVCLDTSGSREAKAAGAAVPARKPAPAQGPPPGAGASDLKTPSTPLKPVPAPARFKDLRGVIVMGIQPGGMFGTTSDTIATFSDGTYTSDLHALFNDGVEASRRKHPKRWGQWRERAGKLELKGHRDKAFDTTRGDWIATPGGADQRLQGCFGDLNSSSGADYGGSTTIGKASTWCFWPDGRFTHSSTVFGASHGGGVSAVMRSSSPRTRGRYRIDGYRVSFVYDDGRQVRGSFSYLNKSRTHIGLNGRRFMGAGK